MPDPLQSATPSTTTTKTTATSTRNVHSNQTRAKKMEVYTLSSCGHVSLAWIARIRRKYDEGVVRFAPPHKERRVRDQMATLTPPQRACLHTLLAKWNERCCNADGDIVELSDELLLRVARNSPGRPFHSATAWKILKKWNPRYGTLTARELEPQLHTKTLFPLPGLKTLEGENEVFYMRPCRFVPKEMKIRDVIDNLAYVMNTMVEREGPCTNGIAFLANMDDWEMKHFASDYCFQFMMMLQGRIGTRVTLFLIVNPPSWFGSVWKMMKPMLAPSFRTRVRMIPESELPSYLTPGYQAYLPDEMASGTVDTDILVRDFIVYRKLVEDEMMQQKQRGRSWWNSTSSSVQKQRRETVEMAKNWLDRRVAGTPQFCPRRSARSLFRGISAIRENSNPKIGESKTTESLEFDVGTGRDLTESSESSSSGIDALFSALEIVPSRRVALSSTQNLTVTQEIEEVPAIPKSRDFERRLESVF